VNNRSIYPLEFISRFGYPTISIQQAAVLTLIVGMGPTMRQAQSRVYSRIKNVLIPNMYYRTDNGDRWVEDTDRLHTWGYLR
jgi:phosphoribosylamine---glycine ligase